MRCGVVSCSFDPALLWLWHRMEAQVLIQFLAGELPYVQNEPHQNKKKKKKKERKKEKKKKEKKEHKKKKNEIKIN